MYINTFNKLGAVSKHILMSDFKKKHGLFESEIAK